ncbi:MAG: protease [Bacteroidetes bacterium]|nr:protease [Bacteroidota bacterium]
MAYQEYRPQGGGLSSIPTVVKNLLILNILFYITTQILQSKGIDLTDKLGLHYFTSDKFQPYQLITYMFMHGSITHILFNMFALFMFGSQLEKYWGAKRFLIFYMITGVGAGLIQSFVTYLRIRSLLPDVPADQLNELLTRGGQIIEEGKNFINPAAAQANLLMYTVSIGASGAIFGILVAFGMLFPNTELYLMLIPIPIKAKYAVVLYGVVELFLGVANFAGDDVAHFAHVGGAIFGFILVKFWQRNSKHFY